MSFQKKTAIETAIECVDRKEMRKNLESLFVPDAATGYFVIFTSSNPNEAYCGTESYNVPHYKRVSMFSRLLHVTHKENDEWQEEEGLNT